jgi:hypothetical protein
VVSELVLNFKKLRSMTGSRTSMVEEPKK